MSNDRPVYNRGPHVGGDGPLEGLSAQHEALFEGYLTLFRRRLSVHAFQNGYYGTELSELALVEVVEELTAKMRVDCQLTDEQHRALKGALLRTIFSARKALWVKK